MFGRSYMKEGKGVNKRDPNEKRIKIFFEVLFRKLWNLCKLNLLYVLTCIPTFLVMLIVSGIVSSRITDASSGVLAQAMGLAAPDMANAEFARYMVIFDIAIRVVISFLVTVFWGMGPFTAGYTYIQRNYAREEHAWMLSDFFGKTKQNFGQAFLVWITDLVFFSVTAIALIFYSQQAGAIRYMSYVMVSVMLVYTLMHFYIYPCMVTFKLSLKDLFKNSLIFALLEGPKNLLIALVLLAIHIGVPYIAIAFAWPVLSWVVFIILEFVILVALSGFIVNFWVYPTIEKYIIEAEKAANEAEENI